MSMTILQDIRLDDGMAVTAAILKDAESLYVSNIDLEGKPQIRKIGGGFYDSGAFWFGTAKCEHFYAEISQNPWICIYVEDRSFTYTLSGKVCFCEDAEKVRASFRADKRLFEKYETQPEMIIPFFLTEAKGMLTIEAEGISPNNDTFETKNVIQKYYDLPVGDEAPVGMTIKKKTELRDRLLRILQRREDEGGDTSEEGIFMQKLYDGALLAAAECAKKLWARMDVQQIERAVLYETYDERERFVLLAKKLIGNAVIAEPEDFTWYLNKETIADLYRKFCESNT